MSDEKPTGVLKRALDRNRDEVVVVCMRASSMLLIALGAIFAARLLGTDEYGRYASVTAYITIVMSAISAGHVERAIRIGAAGDAATRRAQASIVAHDLIRFAPVWIFIALPFGFATDLSFLTFALVGLPIALLLGLAHTLEGFARGSLRNLRDLLPILLLGPLAVVAGCAGALALDASVGAAGLLLYRLALIALTVAYFLVRLEITPARVWRARHSREVESVRGFAVAKLLFAVQRMSSILVAGLVSSTAAGQYAAAFRSAEPIAAGMTAVMLLVGPATAAAVQSGRLAETSKEIKLHGRIGFGLAIIPAAVVLIWPSFVLGLFGSDFTEASSALRILAVGALIVTFFGPSVLFANMANLKRQVAAWMVAAVTLQLGGAAILLATDQATVTRIAILDLAGTTLWSVGLWLTCRRRLGMTTAII
jgi:O-antigen/teichoic acid export membrane protein